MFIGGNMPLLGKTRRDLEAIQRVQDTEQGAKIPGARPERPGLLYRLGRLVGARVEVPDGGSGPESVSGSSQPLEGSNYRPPGGGGPEGR